MPILDPVEEMRRKYEQTHPNQSYLWKKDNLPLTSNQNPSISSAPTNNNVLPQGSLQGTMAQPQKQGSLTDFSAVMRAISESAYDYRQKKEGKVIGKQFDPSKVSGSIFKQIMGTVEAARGSDISKMYGSAVEAAKFDLQQKEEQRQFDIQQENKKWDVIAKKTEAGIDSIYIPAGTLADRNNNPGNLRFVGQAGAQPGEGGFAKFNTPEDGWQALINQVQLDQSRGMTLAQFVNKYAPPTENNTSLYVQQMAAWLGTSPDVQLSALDYEQVAQMVAKKESGASVIKGKGSQDSVNAWAERIQAGQAKITDIPSTQTQLRNDVTVALQAAGNSTEGKPTTTELGKEALNTAQGLLDKMKSGTGTSAVGTSRLFHLQDIPGTAPSDFAIQFQSLKDKLSLDAVKYLKGQGQVSDAERALLSSAVTKLNLSQSEEEFKNTLQEIIDKLSGNDQQYQIGEIVEKNGKRYKKVEGGWEEL